MASDLLSIGSSGVLAQQKLLYTTGNNISNVNTQGYTRQRTDLYTNVVSLGVGMSQTNRLINSYAQRELWRDTSNVEFYQAAYQQMYNTDQLLSSSANSINTALSSYFSAFDTANRSPASSSSREELLSQVNGMVQRYQSLSSSLDTQFQTINGTIEGEVKSINSLLTGINDLNQQIIKADKSSDGTTLNIIDQRDELIRQLSEKMDVRTVSQANGSTLVNLSTGQSLVLASGAATLAVTPGDPDTRETGLQLKIDNSTSSLKSSVGGSLGGYFQARDELAPIQRQLGQQAVAFADAMNSQNKLGMTLANKLGSDIFTLPTSSGLPDSDNAGTGSISVSFMAGEGSNVTPNDFEVRFTSPTAFEVYLLDDSGKASLLTNGSTPPSQFQMANYGIQFDVSGVPVAGDVITLQPTRGAASGLATAITNTDDFALAAPVKVAAASSNYGSGTIALSGVYNTDASSGLNSASMKATAPQQVVIDSSGNYAVYDGTGTLIGTAPASTKGQNLLANLQNPLGGPLVYGDVKSTPGFEFSVSGTVKANDKFTISFNTSGFTDNYNGLAMANLQNQDLVRKGSSTGTDNKQSFSEAYSATVADLGSTVKSLKSSADAAEAKQTQSLNTYNSSAGVNLDEEAANLIRFQQAYAASAQIVSAAKTVFDSLLSAVR